MAYGNLNQRGDRRTTKITTEKKKWLALWTLFLYRIGSHMLDFALDMALLREYWNKGHWWYFSLTFVLVIFPAAITSYLNWKYYAAKWHIKRKIEETNDRYKFKANEMIVVDSNARFYLRAVLCLLLVSPIARYIDIFCYGREQYLSTKDELKKRALYKEARTKETERSQFLQLCESFMESAPQLLLQMYVLAQTTTPNRLSTMVPQVLSVLMSLTSLSLGLIQFQKVMQQQDMACCLKWLVFPAHFFCIGTRVVTIAFFTADLRDNHFEKSYLFWIFLLIHCMLMAIFFRPRQHQLSPPPAAYGDDDVDAEQRSIIVTDSFPITDRRQSEGTRTRRFFLFVSLIFTQIFTFIPFKPDDQQQPSTRLRYALSFYAICFIENIAMNIVFIVSPFGAAYNEDDPDLILVVLLCLIFQLFFIVGSCILTSSYYSQKRCCCCPVYCIRQQQQQQSRNTRIAPYFGLDQLPVTQSYSDILNKILMDLGSNRNAESSEESEQFFKALAQDKDMNVNCRDEINRTPLMLLCSKNISKNFTFLASTLLERDDINLKLKDREGSNTLHLLLASNRNFVDKSLIEKLISHPSSSILNDRNKDDSILNDRNKDGMNALHLLCASSYKDKNVIELIQLLIDKGSDINAQDKEGLNALHHILCSSRNYDYSRGEEETTNVMALVNFVHLLIKNKINIKAKTKSGLYALQLFNKNQRDRCDDDSKKEIIKLLDTEREQQKK